MAFSVTSKCWVFAAALILSSVFGCKLGAAEDEQPQSGPEGQDPAQVVAKALLCFNEKSIYSSCEEAYRLTEAGNLNVSPGNTDQFCEGPCLAETNLVLDCVENILKNFKFYNKATAQDIRDTIHAGCSYTNERGNFNVTEHLEAEDSSGNRVTKRSVLLGLVLLMIPQMLCFAMRLL